MSEDRRDGENKVRDKKKQAVRKLAPDELAAFSGQMSLIINSGLSVLDGLEIMRDDAENQDEKIILEAMIEDFAVTTSLASAMKAAGVFPSYMIGMVETGESTGNLDKVMAGLEHQYLRESDMQKSIYQAVVYPVVLSVMVTAVILVLIIQVMPVFDRVFSELGTAMTGVPLVLSRIGNSLSGSGFVIMVVVLIIALVLLIMGKTDSGQGQLRKLGYKLPGIRKSRHGESASRFAAHMSLVLSSGLTVDQGLRMADEVIDDQQFREQLAQCRSLMDKGESFSMALRESRIFSGIYSQLVETGSRTGNMDEAMDKVADLYREELEGQVDARLARLEPALVVIMSVIVGGILLSVMIPLISIMSAL